MELDEVIRKQVDLLRNGYNIKIYPLEVEKLCNECDAENFKFAILNELGYKQIRVDTLVPNAPFHRASLIGFNVPNGSKWFIVDPTYGQFYSNREFRDYMFINYNDFSCRLLRDGFIECTPDNFTSYINGFVFSGAFNEITDLVLVAENVQENILAGLYNLDTKIKTKR